ncbi:MAG TPA: hypothetical protein VFB06_11305 [Streptosporangiaceae bacterium]|nr:hypothetical protein [Streptosporangiaceae bacterium]
MTADELLRRAAACQACGKEHRYRAISSNQATWASPEDGHAYRPVLDADTVAKLRCLATGEYVSPWANPVSLKRSLADRVLRV